MREPQLGNIVLYCANKDGKQYPAIVVEVEDVPHGRPIGVKLLAFTPAGTYTVSELPGNPMYIYQGNNPGQWQWHDIPIA